MDGRYSRAGNGTGAQNPAYRSTHPFFPGLTLDDVLGILNRARKL
jgi:hypothetical protein